MTMFSSATAGLVTLIVLTTLNSIVLSDSLADDILGRVLKSEKNNFISSDVIFGNIVDDFKSSVTSNAKKRSKRDLTTASDSKSSHLANAVNFQSEEDKDEYESALLKKGAAPAFRLEHDTKDALNTNEIAQEFNIHNKALGTAEAPTKKSKTSPNDVQDHDGDDDDFDDDDDDEYGIQVKPPIGVRLENNYHFDPILKARDEQRLEIIADDLKEYYKVHPKKLIAAEQMEPIPSKIKYHSALRYAKRLQKALQLKTLNKKKYVPQNGFREQLESYNIYDMIKNGLSTSKFEARFHNHYYALSISDDEDGFGGTVYLLNKEIRYPKVCGRHFGYKMEVGTVVNIHFKSKEPPVIGKSVSGGNCGVERMPSLSNIIPVPEAVKNCESKEFYDEYMKHYNNIIVPVKISDNDQCTINMLKCKAIQKIMNIEVGKVAENTKSSMNFETTSNEKDYSDSDLYDEDNDESSELMTARKLVKRSPGPSTKKRGSFIKNGAKKIMKSKTAHSLLKTVGKHAIQGCLTVAQSSLICATRS